MYHDTLLAEARAKITWGESISDVRDYLTSNGMSSADADVAIKELDQERTEEVRKRGTRDLILGLVLTGGAGGLLAVMLSSSYSRIPLRSPKLFGILALVVIYGGWKLTSGIIRLLSPKSDRSSISDVSD